MHQMRRCMGIELAGRILLWTLQKEQGAFHQVLHAQVGITCEAGRSEEQ